MSPRSGYAGLSSIVPHGRLLSCDCSLICISVRVAQYMPVGVDALSVAPFGVTSMV